MTQTIYAVENCYNCEFIGFTTLNQAQNYILKEYFEHYVDDVLNHDTDINRETLVIIKQDIDNLFKNNCIDDYMYIHEVGMYQ